MSTCRIANLNLLKSAVRFRGQRIRGSCVAADLQVRPD